ncbi:hypothetical protein ACVM5L_003891 [Escherichia coli]|uniref:hypothetical protein n=1 Tax=Escherichia TaxID=561 RepID=UPI003AF9A538
MYPVIDAALYLRFSVLFCYPYTNLQHFIIFFLGHRPDHPGKLYLVTDNRCRA